MSEAVQSAGVRHRMGRATLRLGWSEGDAWTIGIGLALALALAISTIPAVLDARNAAPRAAAPAVQAPVEPAAPAAPAALPAEPVALPPPELMPQPLLGPLVPLSPATSARDEPAAPPDPDPVSRPTGAAPPAPGEVRQFAALPAGSEPGAVAASGDGNVWAGTDAPEREGTAAQLLTWDRAGVLKGAAKVPEQPADRSRGLTGIVALPDGAVAAVDAATSRLLRFDAATRSWSTLATVPDVAPCRVITPAPCQPGLLDTAPLLRGVAVDADGAAYVADSGQGSIWRLAPGKPIEVWYSSADVVGPDGLAGLAVGADGHLRAVVTRLAGLQSTGAGALLRIARAEDGRAGARTVIAAFQAGEDPSDVALGASGNAYVALRGANALVTLDSTGFEQLRVVDDALENPVAVDLAAGRALVTSVAPTPAVLEVGVDDTPLAPTSPSPSAPAGGSPRG